MDSFKMYRALMQERPDLFNNNGEPGAIKIIKDPERILAEQKRIQAELRAQGKPEHWIEIGVLAEDKWFYVLRDMVEFPGGSVGGYLRHIARSNIDGGFGVVLICLKQEEILLIKKFRHEQRNWSWEFPRGFGEPELTADENARKELLEEIGVSPMRLMLLSHIPEGKGGVSIFYAEVPPDQNVQVDFDESIAAFRWVSRMELDQMIKMGEFRDYYSLWAYTLAQTDEIFKK